jgi:hypothetical protein
MKTAVLSFSDTLRKDKQTLDNINAKQTSGADRLKKETAVIDSIPVTYLSFFKTIFLALFSFGLFVFMLMFMTVVSRRDL